MSARELIFNTHGNEKQKEAWRAWADTTITDIVYGGAKGTGKSYLGCAVIFADALTYPGTHYFIARKTGSDLTKFTIPSINEVLTDFNIPQTMWRYNGQDNFYTLYNDSRVYLLAAKYLPSDPQYQRFGSMQMTRGWIEEAGEFETDAKRNLQISIGRWKNDEYNLTGKLLQTCNPSKNYLYAEYYRPHKEGRLEPYKRFIQALPEDNKRLDSGYIEHLHRTLTGVQKQRLLFGNWEYDDDPDALINYDAILDAFNNDHVQPDPARKYITADIAAQGSDHFRVGVWYGFVLVDHLSMPKSGGAEIIEAINRMRAKHGVRPSNVVYDSDGVGAFVGGKGGFIVNAKPFLNGSSPVGDEDKGFQNLKTQCYYYLADRINAGQMYLKAITEPHDREQVKEELEQVKSYDSDKDGRLKILPKDQVKANIGRSPDWSDMLMMRMYFELPHKRLPGML